MKYNSPSKDKKTKQYFNPKCKRNTIQSNNPDDYFKKKATWKFHRSCLNNKLSISRNNCLVWEDEILPKLIEFQEMTWAEITNIPKGRGQGSKHHNVTLDDITKEGIEILRDLKIECDEVFSLRLSGTGRIIGFLDLGILEILCYDPDHKFVRSIKK